jgi:hypothetical protein
MDVQGGRGQKLKALHLPRNGGYLPGSSFFGGSRAFFVYVTIEGIKAPHIQLVPVSKRSQVVVDVPKQKRSHLQHVLISLLAAR